MNLVPLLLLALTTDPTAEDFSKYFDRAAKAKSGIVKKAEDSIAEMEDRSRTMTGPKLANAKKGIATMQKELEAIKDAKPFAYMSKSPTVGEIGVIEKCIPLSVIDKNVFVASIPAVGDKEFMAVLTVDSTSKIKKGTQEIALDYVWVVTEIHDSKKQYDSEGKSESVKSAIRYIGLRRFFIAESIKKTELESHRKEYEAAKKLVKNAAG